MAELTPKAAQQLKFMMRCVLGQAGSDHVGIGTAANGCRFSYANVDGIGGCRLMMQNRRTGSTYALAAQKGHQIAWLMGRHTRNFLGPVLHMVNGEPRITTGAALKEDLNGIHAHV